MTKTKARELVQFGSNVRKHREEKDWPEEQLAEKAGTMRSQHPNKTRRRAMIAMTQQPAHSGYAIFRAYFFQGHMPACYDGNNLPVVFATETDAQREIAANQITRLQEFLDGERDFADAITCDEFVLPVSVFPDGSISTDDGRKFGRLD